ncbi:unnamed protein product [Vitrella brassicaformis CCMP3155]|uniref:Uncharacterized protein n=1 Tax=Vitrella brassicaformis (strain CCMP3155) TaxID=1169540 RepID=A0A0G4ENB5_VITBC|nr:unnamed protein product [Vitrella brassicaformis CCMP3155]|eukprot:CEL98487.1 unnamed protein product [Vitrella brassicaformis CCMP3155]
MKASLVSCTVCLLACLGAVSALRRLVPSVSIPTRKIERIVFSKFLYSEEKNCTKQQVSPDRELKFSFVSQDIAGWHSGYVEGGDKAVYHLGSEDMFYKKPKISPLMPVPQIVSAASLRKAIILRNFQCPSAHVSVDVALGAPGAVKAGAVGLVLRVELYQVVDGEATVLDTKKKWGDGREVQLQGYPQFYRLVLDDDLGDVTVSLTSLQEGVQQDLNYTRPQQSPSELANPKAQAIGLVTSNGGGSFKKLSVEPIDYEALLPPNPPQVTPAPFSISGGGKQGLHPESGTDYCPPGALCAPEPYKAFHVD